MDPKALWRAMTAKETWDCQKTVGRALGSPAGSCLRQEKRPSELAEGLSFLKLQRFAGNLFCALG
jgi:hypothetical protein